MGWASRANRKERERTGRDGKWGNFTPYTSPPRKYEAQPTRSGGSTHSERLLARLCRDTFLSSSSYPNIFRAERRGTETISKEVCDLLVVFEDDVLIFSDKDCAFPDHDSLDLSWSRWYRRAVAKSAAQLHGAERVIRSGEALFLDRELTHAFPLSLPDPTRMRVHRILVAHGVSERCRKELGGNGTLMIRPALIGDDHLKAEAQGGMPFAIGKVDAKQPFVHILDDSSLELLLRTLDTAPDLINYLTKKEQFISSGRLEFATGEEALLGLFLSDIDPDGEHGFVVDSPDPIRINESWWHRYAASREAAAKSEADRVSYLWDGLIERFAKHFREGTAEHLSSISAAEHALILRFFARENRTRRRSLSEIVIDMIKTTVPNQRRLRVMPPLRPGDPYWVLLVFPFLRSVSYEANRETRRGFLEACALVTKLMNPDALDIVGFATESGEGTSRSEDAMYLDARIWTPEMEEHARQLRKEYNILTNADRREFTVQEYPV